MATMADHRMLRMKPTLVVTSAYAGTTDESGTGTGRLSTH